MEAKKKAEKLIEKFGTKEQAINCVEEIITSSMNGYLLNDRKVSNFQVKLRDYWKEVEVEIKSFKNV